MIQNAIATDDVELLRDIDLYLNHPLYAFQPRPDKPQEYDEQFSFVNDQFTGIAVALGGTASGKTMAAGYKVARFILETPAPRPLTPFLVCSQTFDMVGSIWQEKLSTFIDPEHIESIRWRNVGRLWPSSVQLKPDKFGNSWVLDFRSYGEGREQFQSISAGGFWLDELCPHEILIEIWGRMRDYCFPGSKVYSLTPLAPAPELEELFANQEDTEIAENWKFYRLNTGLNDTLSDEWFKSYYASLPKNMHQTRMIGAFAHFEGMIYNEFDERIHVVDPFKIPKNAFHYRGIDWGWNHPAVCLWMALVDKTWYVYNELVMSETFTEDFADAIKEVEWDFSSPVFRSTYADYADPQAMAKFGRLGIPCSSPDKAVNLGIESVSRKFKGGEGKPELFIFRNCKKTIEQIKSYQWEKVNKNAMNLKPKSDQPLKYNDDTCDALRYVIHTTTQTITKPWKGVVQPKPDRRMFGTSHR